MREQEEILLQTQKYCIKRITSPKGFSSEMYDQQYDEWCTILSGSAVLDIEGIEKTITSGEHVFIPKHTPHKIISTDTNQETVWLAIYIY